MLAIGRVLEVVPPEALRYLVIREKPSRTINFDPGLPLLQLVDQIDDVHAKHRDERSIELSQAGGFRAVGVPFKHLVVVGQTARFDEDKVIEILERSGYPDLDRSAVVGRLAYAERWLEDFAPEEIRFEVRQSLPAEVEQLDAQQREFLVRLADALQAGMDGEQIHQLVHDLAKQYESLKPAALFQAIYIALLGKPRGPRAGFFIASLGAEFCAQRFRAAAAAPGRSA